MARVHSGDHTDMNMHQKLNYEVTHHFDGLDISEDEFRRLLNIASWNGAIPHFNRRGPGSVGDAVRTPSR